MQTAVPEAMCITAHAEDELDDIPKEISQFNVVGSGPGIGNGKHASYMLKNLIQSQKSPLVLDADAVNILAEYEELLKKLPENSILTPHPGEFRRLVGAWKSDREKLEKQINISKKYKIIVVLKGGHTSVSNPAGEVYFNTTGNPGMATGGSGDVLLGMITAFIGRGYVPFEAACIGAYIHGLAGDIASLDFGEESLKAGDIIDYIPEAFKAVY